MELHHILCILHVIRNMFQPSPWGKGKGGKGGTERGGISRLWQSIKEDYRKLTDNLLINERVS